MAESNLLKDTIEVSVNDETYEFQIPSYYDELKVGTREKNIRRELEADIGGSGPGDAEGLDNTIYFMIRTAAIFEVLLRKGPAWAYTKNGTGAPIVDFKKWPKDKVGTAMQVGVVYNDEIARFRSGGVSDGNADGSETMESQPNTGDQSV